MALEIPNNNIHLWFAFPDAISDETLLLRYQQLLNDEEKKRWQRFHFARHRHHYLVTRALIRSTLSYYIDIDPADWRFSFNPYGKPEIISALADKPIRFNLSHTDGLVMCAIVLENDIGADIENLQKKHATLKIAEHVFSKQEIEALQNMPEHEQAQRFFEYWTLKEAYIKARGMGLSLPLNQFGFILRENQPVEINFDSRMDDNPEHWQFWQLRPAEHHVAAVAIKSTTPIKYQLVINNVVPLQ